MADRSSMGTQPAIPYSTFPIPGQLELAGSAFWAAEAVAEEVSALGFAVPGKNSLVARGAFS